MEFPQKIRITMIRFAFSFALLTYCFPVFAQTAVVEDQGASISTYSSGLPELQFLKAILVAESEGKAQLRLSIDTQKMGEDMAQHLDIATGPHYSWADPEQAAALMLNAIKAMQQELESTRAEMKSLQSDLNNMKANLNTIIDMILSQEFHDRVNKN
jgi:hypothetical protein